MKNKSVLKKVLIGAGILLAIAAAYVLAVFEFLFVPSFSRKSPSEKDNLAHFKTEENVAVYEDAKTLIAKINPEKLQIMSDDGLKLVAYNLPAEKSKGTFILMHGYHSLPIREFARLFTFYNSLGYNVIMPFQRSHGESEGKYITFGIKERYDLQKWILKANEIYGAEKPVFLEGISMGCATVLMSLGLELPPNVRGAIADCGFTSPYEIIWKVLTKDKKIPTASLVIKIGNFLTKHVAGFDMNEYSTIDALRENNIPVLFIHGANDDFVPVEMTIANFEVCTAEKSLFLVENCPHAIACFVSPEKYNGKVVKFLEKHSN